MSPGGMALVRASYGVPARRGATITFRGGRDPVSGPILSCDGSHLYMRDERTGRRVGPLHPTWEIDYGDGRDHSAEHDARMSVMSDWLAGRLSAETYRARLAALPTVAPAGS